MKDAVQAVADSQAQVLDLNHYIFHKVTFGQEEIQGERVRRIELPRKGFPAWTVVVRADWTNDNPDVFYFITGPIVIEATAIEVVAALPEEED